jgi:hypothetical protein
LLARSLVIGLAIVQVTSALVPTKTTLFQPTTLVECGAIGDTLALMVTAAFLLAFFGG